VGSEHGWNKRLLLKSVGGCRVVQAWQAVEAEFKDVVDGLWSQSKKFIIDSCLETLMALDYGRVLRPSNISEPT